MGGLLLCTKTAQVPFKVKDADISLYSMEELCYYINNNIYMIGAGFFDDDLLDFVENGLGLSKTAERLKDEMYRKVPYTAMIKTILEGSSYYSAEEKEEIREVLQELDNKTVEEKIKMRGDLLAQNGRYAGALETYRQLTKKRGEPADIGMLGCIWNNMGVVNAKLFLYDEAADCFEKACDICDGQEFMDNLICILILSEDKERLESVKKKYNISDAVVRKYESAVDMARKEVKNSMETSPVAKKLTYDPEKELTDFYANSDEIINMWKKEYREQIK